MILTPRSPICSVQIIELRYGRPSASMILEVIGDDQQATSGAQQAAETSQCY